MMWVGYACLLLGGVLGAVVCVKVISGYVKGMPS
jgi:hypothetical protein